MPHIFDPIWKNTTNLINPALEAENGVFACAPGGSATPFLDGAVNIGLKDTNSFENCPKILIDTGALVPSGIAIADQFRRWKR